MTILDSQYGNEYKTLDVPKDKTLVNMIERHVSKCRIKDGQVSNDHPPPCCWLDDPQKALFSQPVCFFLIYLSASHEFWKNTMV